MIQRTTHMLLFLLALMACASSAAAEQALRLTGPAVRETIPLLRMLHNPPLISGSRSAVFVPWSSPEQLRSLIATKKVDVAIMTIASAATIHNKGIPCAVVAVYSSPAWIISTDLGLHRFEQLDGQEIMLPFGPGEMPELSLRILMEKRGMRFVPRHVGSALEAVAMLQSGSGRYALLAEPAASKALTAFAQVGKNTENIPHRCFNIRELWAESFPQSKEMPFGAVTVVGPMAENTEALTAIRASYLENARMVRAEGPEMSFVAMHKNFPALERHLAEMSREEACDIRILNAEHAGIFINFFLVQLYELSPASIGGKIPGDKFLRLADAPR